MTPDTHAMWSSAVAEREAAREECRQLRIRIAGLEERKQELLAEVASLRAEVRVSDQRLAGQYDESAATIAALSAELDQAHAAGAALLAERAALAEHVTRRDLAIDALTRRVAEVMADCDRMQDAAVDVITRLLEEIWRRGEAARRVAAYARKLRTAGRAP